MFLSLSWCLSVFFCVYGSVCVSVTYGTTQRRSGSESGSDRPARRAERWRVWEARQMVKRAVRGSERQIGGSAGGSEGLTRGSGGHPGGLRGESGGVWGRGTEKCRNVETKSQISPMWHQRASTPSGLMTKKEASHRCTPSGTCFALSFSLTLSKHSLASGTH